MTAELSESGFSEMRSNYLAMTTDTLCGHAFEKSLDLLESKQRANEWRLTINAVAILTPLARQFTWIIPIALKLPLVPLEFVVPNLARIVALHRVRLHKYTESPNAPENADSTSLGYAQAGCSGN